MNSAIEEHHAERTIRRWGSGRAWIGFLGLAYVELRALLALVALISSEGGPGRSSLLVLAFARLLLPLVLGVPALQAAWGHRARVATGRLELAGLLDNARVRLDDVAAVALVGPRVLLLSPRDVLAGLFVPDGAQPWLHDLRTACGVPVSGASAPLCNGLRTETSGALEPVIDRVFLRRWCGVLAAAAVLTSLVFALSQSLRGGPWRTGLFAGSGFLLAIPLVLRRVGLHPSPGRLLRRAHLLGLTLTARIEAGRLSLAKPRGLVLSRGQVALVAWWGRRSKVLRQSADRDALVALGEYLSRETGFPFDPGPATGP